MRSYPKSFNFLLKNFLKEKCRARIKKNFFFAPSIVVIWFTKHSLPDKKLSLGATVIFASVFVVSQVNGTSRSSTKFVVYPHQPWPRNPSFLTSPQRSISSLHSEEVSSLIHWSRKIFHVDHFPSRLIPVLLLALWTLNFSRYPGIIPVDFTHAAVRPLLKNIAFVKMKPQEGSMTSF